MCTFVCRIHVDGTLCTDCENKFPPMRTIKYESESESTLMSFSSIKYKHFKKLA